MAQTVYFYSKEAKTLPRDLEQNVPGVRTHELLNQSNLMEYLKVLRNQIICAEFETLTDLGPYQLSLLQYASKHNFIIVLLSETLEEKRNLLVAQGMDVLYWPTKIENLYSKVENGLNLVSSRSRNNLVLRYPKMTIIPDSLQVNIEEDNEVRSVYMTRTQFKIFYLLAKNPEKVKTREEIINHIFTDRKEITDRNIDSHISNIRKMLGFFKATIVSVRGRGYKFSSL